jgi:hypothetical protein
MATEEAPPKEWRPATPASTDNGEDDSGDDGSSSSDDTSVSYESEQFMPRPAKKARTEEEMDPDYDPKAEEVGQVLRSRSEEDATVSPTETISIYVEPALS